MTEADWLARSSPYQMANFLCERFSDRKLRLFCVACCRRIENLLIDDRSRIAVEAGERFADGLVKRKERQRISAAALAVKIACQVGSPDFDQLLSYRKAAGAASTCVSPNASKWACFLAIGTAEAAGLTSGQTAFDAEQAAQVRMLQCIFNPFHPVIVDCRWLDWHDATVPKIAQRIYDERDFSLMPILADALEDAGCDNEAMLRHCREPGEHVRGCWVIDLLLGRE